MTFPFFGDDAEGDRIGPHDDSHARGDAGPQPARRAPTRSRAGSLEGAETPEEYVQRSSRYLGDESFTYLETPPPAACTLDGFLHDAKTGYCQQYSGAMALLLRMGGTRRASSPGSRPARRTRRPASTRARLRRPLVGRGVLPGLGLAHVRPDARRFAGAAASPPTPQHSGARPPARRPGSAHPLAERGAGVPGRRQSSPWWSWPLRVLARPRHLWPCGRSPCAAGAAARRPRCPSSSAPCAGPAARRPGTTLHALEPRFSATPAAAGYCARCARAATGRPSHPTRAQRRGLRSELGRGAGLLGRLRAWWAFPPRNIAARYNRWDGRCL